MGILSGRIRGVQGMKNAGLPDRAQRNCSTKIVFTPCAPMLRCGTIKTNGRIILMKRMSTIAAGLLIGAAAFQYGNVASGQSDGWITLLDTGNKGDWSKVGTANWEMKDGAMTADKLNGKELGYLVTKNSY